MPDALDILASQSGTAQPKDALDQLADSYLPDFGKQMRAQMVGRANDLDNAGMTTSMANAVAGGMNPRSPLSIAGTVAGSPFALLDAALPHLTPEERKQLAKTNPKLESVEAASELV